MIFNLEDTGATTGGSVGEYIYNQIFVKGEYPDTFTPDDVVVDIGGHIGLFAMYASTRIPNGHVYSYEPSPFNYKRFVEHMEKNNIKNVSVLPCAVTGGHVDTTLYLSQDTGANSIYQKCAHEYFQPNPTTKSCTVSSTTLSDIIEKVGGYISYLKIDCEGAEYDILESITPDEFLKIKQVVLEWHPVDGKSIQALASLLESNGYSVTTEGGSYGILIARRTGA
jgi:FkbM family methyltransferase